jgi:hypothetical protein
MSNQEPSQPSPPTFNPVLRMLAQTFLGRLKAAGLKPRGVKATDRAVEFFVGAFAYQTAIDDKTAAPMLDFICMMISTRGVEYVVELAGE